MTTEEEDRSGITMFMHCRRCALEERPKGESPMSYARIQAGVVRPGLIRVWCNRHNMLVCDITGKVKGPTAQIG